MVKKLLINWLGEIGSPFLADTADTKAQRVKEETSTSKKIFTTFSTALSHHQVPSLIFYCQHSLGLSMHLRFSFHRRPPIALLSAPTLVVLPDFSNPLTGELSTLALG